MAIVTFSLQSGSNGNAIYVETPDARLLFDAGISGKQAAIRMARHGRDIRDCDALIISHDHADHVRGAGVFARKFGLPVVMTAPTYRQVAQYLGHMPNVSHFQPGQTLRFGGTRVQTIRTPHDATDGVAFVVSRGRRRLGILTDLGCPFAELIDVIGSLDAAYLEANYDPQMLADGPYPWPLKQRIRGDGGHLSNDEAGALAGRAGAKLRWLALAHLSEQNNTPELAERTVRDRLDGSLPLMRAGRYGVSDCWDV